MISTAINTGLDNVDPLLLTVLTIFGSVIASSGFWTYIMHRAEKNNAATKLSLGLAHNEIVTQGLGFIDRGYIYKDEYEDYVKYLYAPYSTFGGYGLAEKVFQEVSGLPIKRYSNSNHGLGEAVRKYDVPDSAKGSREPPINIIEKNSR